MAGKSRPCPYCGSEVSAPSQEQPEDISGTKCGACGNLVAFISPGAPPAASADATKENRNAAMELMSEGLRLAHDKDYETAAIKLRAAADKSPDSIDILMALAAVCSRRNLAYEALSAYQKALAIDPSNEEALFKAGMLFVQQKRYDKGIELLESLLEKDPVNEQAKLMIKIAGSQKKDKAERGAVSYHADAEKERGRKSGPERVYELLANAKRATIVTSSLWALAPVMFIAVRALYGDDQGVERMLMIAITLYCVLLGVVVHELGHGLAAYLNGDDTAYRAGRLTLNPFRHISLIGTVVVPVTVYALSGFAFGWARPVPFNPMKLKRQPRDQVVVSAAGPFTSFAMSYAMFTLFLIFAAIHNNAWPDLAPVEFTVELNIPIETGGGALAPVWFVILELLSIGAIVNLILGVFNLIPIPPLDGGWLLKAIAPQSLAIRLDRNGWVGFAVIIAAVYFGWLVYLFYPAYTVLTGYYYLSGLIL